MLTAERLRQLLSYDQDMGCFVWLVTNSNRAPAGTNAGSLNKVGYMQIRIADERYYAHRLAWLYVTGEWPLAQIDHINGDRCDNRWRNLREATNAQNAANRKATATAGLKGVVRAPDCARWCAYIHVNRQTRNLGYFVTAEEAHAAYCAAARSQFGEFARTE